MLLILGAVLFVVGVVVYSRCINRLKGLPPGPPPLPLLGNLHLMENDMSEKFLAWKQRYGKVFTVWMPEPVVVIGDSKVLQDHIVREGDAFGDRKVQLVFNRLSYGGNYGIVFPENSMWKEQRRFALHSLRNIGFATSSMTSTIVGYGQEIVQRWAATDGRPFDPTPELMSAVGNVILNLVFGKNVPFDNPFLMSMREKMDEVNTTFNAAAIMLYELVPSLATLDEKLGGVTAKFGGANAAVHRIVDKEISEIAATLSMDEAPRSYVEALLQEANKRQLANGDPGDFSRSQLIAAVYDVWTAGFDTTVSTLRHALHYVMSMPEVQQRLQDEIASVVGDRDVTVEDQKSLHYVNAVLVEVQRIHNVLFLNFFRQTDRETVIEGYKLPAGTTILPQFQIVHGDPDEFERPEFFCPARHLNNAGEFVKDPRITPFSIGKRSCIGEGMARMELFLFLTTIVQRLTLSPAGPIPPAMEFTGSFARMLKPYTMRAVART